MTECFLFNHSVIKTFNIGFHVILEVEEMKIEIKSASFWVISTAQLSVFLHVYLQPINVVVYNDPYVEDSSSG
jgi:hypothetical protein